MRETIRGGNRPNNGTLGGKEFRGIEACIQKLKFKRGDED